MSRGVFHQSSTRRNYLLRLLFYWDLLLRGRTHATEKGLVFLDGSIRCDGLWEAETQIPRYQASFLTYHLRIKKLQAFPNGGLGHASVFHHSVNPGLNFCYLNFDQRFLLPSLSSRFYYFIPWIFLRWQRKQSPFRKRAVRNIASIKSQLNQWYFVTRLG